MLLKQMIDDLDCSLVDIGVDGMTILKQGRMVELTSYLIEKRLTSEGGLVNRVAKGDAMKEKLSPDQLTLLEELRDEMNKTNELTNLIFKSMIDYSVMRYVCMALQESFDSLFVDGKLCRRIMPEQAQTIEESYSKLKGVLTFINHKLD